MALKPSQYNTLMRAYSERQLRHAGEAAARRNALFEKYPELAGFQRRMAENAGDRARAGILGDSDALLRLEEASAKLREEKCAFFIENGIKESDFEPVWDCPDCRDTGFIGNQKCHCFTQAAIDLLYEQSNIRDILARENFDTLTMDYYDRSSQEGRRSQYEIMQERISLCHDFVDYFDRGPDNLLFTGPTGTGKTFLSNCIAKALIDTCHSVVYFSAPGLFQVFSDASFSYDEDLQDQADRFVLESDLLIIDDLGTERVNAFASSKLFYTVNERLNRKKSTIISTNLSLDALRDTYTERTASRILSSYEILALSGDDIRLRKRFGV